MRRPPRPPRCRACSALAPGRSRARWAVACQLLAEQARCPPGGSRRASSQPAKSRAWVPFRFPHSRESSNTSTVSMRLARSETGRSSRRPSRPRRSGRGRRLRSGERRRCRRGGSKTVSNLQGPTGIWALFLTQPSRPTNRSNSGSMRTERLSTRRPLPRPRVIFTRRLQPATGLQPIRPRGLRTQRALPIQREAEPPLI
mmetsp:Transcript_53884/g.153536  ORF Transcript_53884/g.153536 Transcript_53884/m.153536 type:complete len:200 (-) Transcript_53884:285-884(-)